MGPVYSKRGCFTCRRRHKKCGEERPICASCTRMNLVCVFPTPFGPRNFTRPARTAEACSDRPASLPEFIPCPRNENVLSRAPEAAFVGDFHFLPVQDAQRAEVTCLLERLFNCLEEEMQTFQSRNKILIPAHQKYLPALFELGTLSCLSVAAVAAALLTNGDLSSPWQLVRCRYQNEVISHLGSDIAGLKAGGVDVPDFNTLVCACHLPVSSIAYDISAPALRKISDGALLIVRRLGGFKSFLATCDQYVMRMIIRSEWIACIVCVTRPAYVDEFERPALTTGFVGPSRANVHNSLARVCNSELLETVCDMRLLLHYRITDGQRNFCASMKEQLCLQSLLEYADLRQAAQQAQHCETNTLQECVLYTLLLIRLKIISHDWEYPRIALMISDRLVRAINETETMFWSEDGALDVLVWVLCIGVALCQRLIDQDRCAGKLASLKRHHLHDQSSNWPFSRIEKVLEMVRTMVWHEKISQNLRNHVSASSESDLNPVINSYSS